LIKGKLIITKCEKHEWKTSSTNESRRFQLALLRLHKNNCYFSNIFAPYHLQFCFTTKLCITIYQMDFKETQTSLELNFVTFFFNLPLSRTKLLKGKVDKISQLIKFGMLINKLNHTKKKLIFYSNPSLFTH